MWEPEEYCTLMNDAVGRKETVVFGCKCEVRYSGRAESYLGVGDRIIIIKTDQTLLIHQPSGSAPINYMKADSSHRFFLENGHLVLKSANLPSKEFLDMKIDRVHFLNCHKLEDGESIIIQGTEEDMARMLYENPNMIEEGFKPVSQEEQTKYGFIDVLGVDKEGVLTAVECKRYRADLASVTQLRRYVEKLMVSKGITQVRGILAAPKITANAEQMLKDWGYSFVSVRPPKYLEEFDKKQSRLDGF
jgi:RecB family endonuclease NucS